MSQTKVSIGFDQKSTDYFARLMGNRPIVAGAHCSDDDGDDNEKKSVFSALGAHCTDGDGDDDDGCKKIAFGQIAFGAHCGGDDDEEDDGDKKQHLFASCV